MKPITLITNFGDSTVFAGIMKGVILTLNPAAQIIDITHTIPANDISSAAYATCISHRLFPPGTIHIVLSGYRGRNVRSAICIEVPEIGYFVGPDNGIFSYILEDYPQAIVREINNPDYFRMDSDLSSHSRDIFAPVAANLSLGRPFEELGPLLDKSQVGHFTDLRPERKAFLDRSRLAGRILFIDTFGNIVSNIRRTDLVEVTQSQLQKSRVLVGVTLPLRNSKMLGYSYNPKITVKGVTNSFEDGEEGQKVAYFNSYGFLEVCTVLGRASNLSHYVNGVSVGVELEIGAGFLLEYW